MPTLPIHPLERLANRKAALKRPQEIIHFSVRHPSSPFIPDASALKYYYTPRLGVSLSGGFDRFRQRDDEADEHLDALLAAIIDLERREGAAVLGEGDVCTWRGMGTKFLVAPYADLDGFEMNATCFQGISHVLQAVHSHSVFELTTKSEKGTIFLEESHSFKLESRARQNGQAPRPGQASQEMMSYWGYKFETLSLLPEPWDVCSRRMIEDREHAVVDNTEQYISVVRTGVGDIRVFLGGEVDAVWDALPTDPTQKINYVELKTAAELAAHPSRNQLLAFERRLLKYWAQSFLLNIPKIIIGYRTPSTTPDGAPDAHISRVEELETTSIPARVRAQAAAQGREPLWQREICIAWWGEVLSWLREHIQGDGVWKIRRKERAGELELWKVEETGYGDILSQDFVAWRRELMNMTVKTET